ncbi:NAD(P)-binding protein [Microthyrium microscopicum]|uniref:NAD(P)-binding protein n=1 Tax=Microthyrium microscopicum TaxID=703497 RepID=A0A6A6UC49_9PEZI|nr:NAD(P)-binding protein [Microthyrium microscopicum]
MSPKSIKNVLVIGATGSVGPAIVNALRSHPQGYTISILTRSSSLDRTRNMFPDSSIKIYTADYSSPDVALSAFQSSFEGQDAIVSATSTFTVAQQRAIIDAAIAAKTVQRFIPSEYGIDTSASDSLKKNLPLALLKTSVVEYLQSRESDISWSAICTGAFFDWSFQIRENMGWNVPSRTAMIFDGGDVPYETTNIDQIGLAVAAALSATPSPGFQDGTGKNVPMSELAKNKYVYVNSFTTTQNEVLDLLEKHTGSKFEVKQVNAAEMAKDGNARAEKSFPGFRPTGNLEYVDGIAESIWATIYGNGNLNNYSANKGLWNDALGLETDDLEASVKGVVEWWDNREGSSKSEDVLTIVPAAT